MNKKILLSIFLIFCLISLSQVSAEDNTTAVLDSIDEISDIEKIETNVEDMSESSTNDESQIISQENDDYLSLDTEEDVYFNASAKSDGDGSINNPFKYVTSNRLPYGCTAHFANGVYEISENCRLLSNDGSALFDVPTKVTFYGESTDGVIFKNVNMETIPFTVADNSQLYIYNATFDNCVIENRGRLEAYGVVFKNGVAIDHYYASTTTVTYNNKFGGAIFSPGSHYATYGSGMKTFLTLEDCLFMNNTAVYGGAIYHDYGTTKIRNTKFIDSYASLYGGVLATDGGSIEIENCEFINYGASGDAGGAIYAKTTNLTVKNSKFHNGYGDFGGAICELNSNLVIENTDFYNNSAKYEGGAIYIMYGSITLNNVNVTLNSALDGGALFVDNCSDVNLNKVKFDKSSAKRYGGTIFSNGMEISTANDVTLGESSAAIGHVIYHQDKYDYDIGYNSNYEMMVYNSSYNGVLPSSYDLRDYGWVTPIRDQQEGGNCWAFAGIAALESCILKATGKSIDLSEENVKNLIELYSAYGWKEDTNEGGHSEMTWGNLISWIGPVLEEDDVYDDYSTLSTLFDSIMHVQNVYYLPARTSFTDNDAIKKAIMDYGAISVLMYADFNSPLNYDEKTSSYFFATSSSGYANHAVTVVGWDDNYNKNNFPMGSMADTNGAWIVKNSWGTEWGDDGYFYVSYYDPVVFKKGEKNVAYTFILNDTVRYNRNYQYDIGGMTDFLYPTGNNQTLYYKNTFTAIGNDILTAVSTIFEEAMDYEASIYINDVLKHTQKGHSFAGYNTIPLITEYQLTAGDKFTVQFKISRVGGAAIPICEVVTATRLTYSEGISFFSTNGQTWNDLYTFTLDRPDIEHRYASQVACIKAFTRSTGETLSTSAEIQTKVASTNMPTIISALVKDENGKIVKKGFVTFEVNGESETVQIDNGIAEYTATFTSEGTFDVKVSFEGEGYKSSSATGKITVTKSEVKSTTISAPDVTILEGEDSSVQITLSDVNGDGVSNADVKLEVDGKTFTAKTNSAGIAVFTVNLAAGTYQATAKFEGNSNYASSTKFATVTVTPAESDNVNVKTTNNGDGSINVIVTDENGKAVTGKDVTVTIDGKEYKATTDSNGIAKITGLSDGNHNINVAVDGKTVTQQSSTINVNSSTQTSDKVSVEYSYNTDGSVNAIITDENGNAVKNTAVTLNVNGKTYSATTNNQGVAKFNVDLINGEYSASIAVSGKTVTSAPSNVKVVNNQKTTSNTIEAEDTTRAQNSAYDIQAKFYDSNGNELANKEVLFILNGNEYSVKTNDYGVAKFTNKLPAGNYIITIQNPATGESVNKNITIVKRITGNVNVKVDYSYTSKYSVRVYGDNGKVVGAGETVKFTINGKSVNVNTDANGYATYKIKGLLPKTYTITATYKGVKVSNKVYVKQILKSKNVKVKKSAKTKKFTATLKTSKGKAIKGKKITFKIKGKKYTAKTNKKGVATIKIKQNLKVGKYKMSITYLKNTIKKTLTIKK